MKFFCFLILFFIAVLSGCSNHKSEKVVVNTKSEVDSIEIIKKPFKNSPNVIEFEIPVFKGTNTRHGVQKRYYQHGSLYSRIPYINGKREGIAYTYYPALKGTEPEVWKEQPYINDTLNGMCRRYFKDGTLQAEYEYKCGLPAIDLKEFNEYGKPAKLPELVLSKNKAGKDFLISVRLSNNSKNVNYFIGNLIDGKYLPEGLKGLQVRDGVGEILVPAGTKSITITAVYLTSYQNRYIVSKTIAL
jgi:antitoxin component YwqK of YwqJK toxin-antitoxin module